MHALSAGRLRMRKATYLPDADKSETIELPVSCFLLPPVRRDRCRRALGRAGQVHETDRPGRGQPPRQPRLHGVAPDDIDPVVCSHLHPDHFRIPPSPYRGFEGQHDVFGDGRIVLVPVPGHTPGMSGARIELDREGTFFPASDAAALKADLDRECAPKNTWNVDAALASPAEIKRMEAGGATVLCGHDDAQWQKVRRGSDRYM